MWLISVDDGESYRSGFTLGESHGDLVGDTGSVFDFFSCGRGCVVTGVATGVGFWIFAALVAAVGGKSVNDGDFARIGEAGSRGGGGSGSCLGSWKLMRDLRNNTSADLWALMGKRQERTLSSV